MKDPEVRTWSGEVRWRAVHKCSQLSQRPCFHFYPPMSKSCGELRKIGRANKQHSFHSRWANMSVCQQGAGPHLFWLSLYCARAGSPTQRAGERLLPHNGFRSWTGIYTCHKSIGLSVFDVQIKFSSFTFWLRVSKYFTRSFVARLFWPIELWSDFRQRIWDKTFFIPHCSICTAAIAGHSSSWQIL